MDYESLKNKILNNNYTDFFEDFCAKFEKNINELKEHIIDIGEEYYRARVGNDILEAAIDDLQRNFLVKQSNGIDALVTVTMKNIDINNIFSEVSLGGTTIHTYSLEVIKIMKEKSKKEKDWVDIKVIDDFGYDENIYFTLKEQLKDMKFTIEPKNWLLRLFFHTLNK